MPEQEKIIVKIGPGRTRIFYRSSPTPYRSSIAQFKPLKIEHGVKGGSPVLNSRKEVNSWLQKNNLFSPMFTD